MPSWCYAVIVPGQKILQRWRSSAWKDTDPDSILVLTFVQQAKRRRIDLVHVNAPKHDHRGVTAGWERDYLKPPRASLRAGRKP